MMHAILYISEAVVPSSLHQPLDYGPLNTRGPEAEYISHVLSHWSGSLSQFSDKSQTV
jgi:hypothetical protein